MGEEREVQEGEVYIMYVCIYIYVCIMYIYIHIYVCIMAGVYIF